MKKARTCVALLLVAAIVLSFACVCSLYAYPTHTHDGHSSHCVLCAVAERVGNLLHAADALGTLFVLLAGLVCLAVFLSPRVVEKPRRVVTPVTLKTKLSW